MNSCKAELETHRFLIQEKLIRYMAYGCISAVKSASYVKHNLVCINLYSANELLFILVAQLKFKCEFVMNRDL